jgi:hypothetical protein
MSSFHVTVDTSGLVREWGEACGEIAEDLAHAVKTAVDAGAKHSQHDHHYQDHTYHLTDTTEGKLESHDRDGAVGVIVWPTDYASYVDKGTSRSRPYPFADKAEKVADEVLEREVAAMVARVESKMGR